MPEQDQLPIAGCEEIVHRVIIHGCALVREGTMLFRHLAMLAPGIASVHQSAFQSCQQYVPMGWMYWGAHIDWHRR
jgi:hypothetical protein